MGPGSREISSEQQFHVDFCRVRLLTLPHTIDRQEEEECFVRELLRQRGSTKEEKN
ncbi:hypothetical protein YC2023_080401 [Brassica napus]